MSSTEGPNTPSTGSISSTYTRVQAVLGVNTSKLLGVLRVSRVLDTEILRVHKVPEVFFLENTLILLRGNGSICEL